MPITAALRVWSDLALAAGLGLVMLMELLAYTTSVDPAPVACVLVASAALSMRRSRPLPAFVLVATALYLLSHLVPGVADQTAVFVIVLFVGLYSLGRHATGSGSWLGALGVLVLIALFVRTDAGAVNIASIAWASAIQGGPWAAGVALRARREREIVMDSAAEDMKRNHQREVERVVAAERATIARELHDVVAHAIAVTVLQARGARTVLATDRDAARRALDAIEQTNTLALGDMRRLLAVLRDTDDPRSESPQPSLRRLDDLIDHVRRSGLEVELSEVGAGRELAPGVELSAYRIIQEALTNVIKHADATHARVRLDYEPHALRVSITDDGTARPGQGVGQGLIGIRERVAVIGGEVAAGPQDDGGFRLEARLPYVVAGS